MHNTAVNISQLENTLVSLMQEWGCQSVHVHLPYSWIDDCVALGLDDNRLFSFNTENEVVIVVCQGTQVVVRHSTDVSSMTPACAA